MGVPAGTDPTHDRSIEGLKTYVAHAIENKVREALEMPLIEMPSRPPA